MKTKKDLYFDIVICGASLGGTIAAYSASQANLKVILLEETDWIGGQLTTQAVPPDEHKDIETTGCTASYRQYRNKVRNYYCSLSGFSQELKDKKIFCPASSEVSYISHPPKLALKILNEMLLDYVKKGNLTISLNSKLLSCEVYNDIIETVTYKINDEEVKIHGKYFLDGTDIGDLIKYSGTEYRVGAESRSETKEEHAPVIGDNEDMQPQIFTAAIENRLSGDYTIPKPEMYDYFKNLKMPYDEFNVFSMYGPDSSTGKAKRFGMFTGEKLDNQELFPLFSYRRIICSANYTDNSEPFDVTLINWPQNDYFIGNLFDSDNDLNNTYMAKQMTLSFVYWLQTDALRMDGGKGYPFFKLNGDYLGTTDGLTKKPYVRESRRIVSLFTITEENIKKGTNPRFYDSVGVGSYPMDLHITTKTHTFLFIPTERFTIPLGAMIPIRMKNLIPACKNIGTTHLRNGCFRLHPVEWNIGEVAGLLAIYLITNKLDMKELYKNKEKIQDFQKYLVSKGIQLYWE